VLVKIKKFGSTKEIEEAVDKDIVEAKSTLGGYLRRLDEIRELAEKMRKVRELVAKLAGKKRSTESLGEINIGDLSLVLDANPVDELNAVESVVHSFQERLSMLTKSREALGSLSELGDIDGMKFMVVETDGVIERILLKID
jgi:hypothetical protein